jgi:hypothetical protein
MEYAHSGIELKNPYGVQSGPTPAPAVAAVAGRSELGPAQRPALLSRRSFEALGGIEDMMRTSGARQRGAANSLAPERKFAEGLGAPSPTETLGASSIR